MVLASTHTMSQTSVRCADPAEHSALTALYEAWGYRGGIAPTDVVYVAERSGLIVGLVRRSYEDGLTLLRGMYIRPSARSEGIGTLLLSAFARALGERACFCIPFAHLTEFYRREGFATVPEANMPAPLALRLNRYRQEGHDVLLMLRDPDSRVHDRAG